MSKLRQPLPAAQAFALVFSSVAFGVAQHWAGAMTPVEFLLALALLAFVVQPVFTLIHELAHGVAACRLGGGPASIMVGRGPWIRFSLGQMRVNFSLLPSRGVLIRGVCRYQADNLSWRSRARVALAGPAATLAELLGELAVAAVVWPAAGTFVRNLIVLSLAGLVGSLVVNLAPMKINRDGRQIAMGNDGTRARMALRLHREGAAAGAAQATPPRFQAAPQPTLFESPPPKLMVGSPAGAGTAASAVAAAERQRDLDRARTSIAPPE